MRDMVAAWRALQGELDPTAHSWESPLWKYRSGPLDSPPWSAVGPASLLHLGLGEGLPPFTPEVSVFEVGKAPQPPFSGEASAWNVCCMELFNHIVEQATYK